MKTICGCRGRKEPICPSQAQPGTNAVYCAAETRDLVLLETRIPSVPALDTAVPRSHNVNKSSFLNLPLGLREEVFSHVLTSDEELFLGTVTLELHPPNHWHPKRCYQECYRSRCLCWLHGSGHIPRCIHGYPAGDPGLSVQLLRVCKQVYSEGARVLYSWNTFAIDICVPNTPALAQCFDISALRLPDFLPLHSIYHPELRAVGFRLRVHEGPQKAFAARFFSSAMLFVLQGVSGAYMAFRRRHEYDSVRDHHSVESEVFAGWSMTYRAPAWCSGRNSPLRRMARPLIVEDLRMSVREAHWNMGTLWEKTSVPCCKSMEGKREQADGPLLDLRVWNDPPLVSGPWTEGDWKSRNAARIYLLRLNRDGQAGFWWGRTHEEPERTAVGSWLGISQTSIVGVSRGLELGYRGLPYGHIWWKKADHGIWHAFRRPVSLVKRPIYRKLREWQLGREAKEGSDASKDGRAAPLPIDDDFFAALMLGSPIQLRNRIADVLVREKK